MLIKEIDLKMVLFYFYGEQSLGPYLIRMEI
jgi:hypothetical protein